MFIPLLFGLSEALLLEYGMYEFGGETFGEPTFEVGADLEIALGGGIMCELVPSRTPAWAAAAAMAAACCLLPLLEFGLLCIRECRVSSSDRLKRFVHPGNWQA